MSYSFTVNAENEFFIALGYENVHSFVMLGVLQNDGSPKLLAKVGKTMAIDKDLNRPCVILGKSLFGLSHSVLTDEAIDSDNTNPDEIHYQAYTINFEQVQSFLSLILEIEKRQIRDNEIVEDMRRRVWKKMKCYVPTAVDQHQITFDYQYLDTWPLERQFPNIDKVAKQAMRLSPVNSCRTTAIQITENVLGYKTGVSNNYIIKPRYHGTLIKRQPCARSFYILPVPPLVFSHLSGDQLTVAKKLYRRLEKLPKLNPTDPDTRAKFAKLKKMYQDITGPNTLDAATLLEKIVEHEHTSALDLYKIRSPNFFSQTLKLKSSTEKLLTNIKSNLRSHLH